MASTWRSGGGRVHVLCPLSGYRTGLPWKNRKSYLRGWVICTMVMFNPVTWKKDPPHGLLYIPWAVYQWFVSPFQSQSHQPLDLSTAPVLKNRTGGSLSCWVRPATVRLVRVGDVDPAVWIGFTQLRSVRTVRIRYGMHDGNSSRKKWV